MGMQVPKAVTFGGRGGAVTLQTAAYASKTAVVASVTDSTAATALPASTNTLAFAVNEFFNAGTDAVYFAFGSSDSVTVDHTTDNCDSVILGGTSRAVPTPEGSTHVAMITESGTSTVVIAPLV